MIRKAILQISKITFYYAHGGACPESCSWIQDQYITICSVCYSLVSEGWWQWSAVRNAVDWMTVNASRCQNPVICLNEPLELCRCKVTHPFLVALECWVQSSLFALHRGIMLRHLICGIAWLDYTTMNILIAARFLNSRLTSFSPQSHRRKILTRTF